MSADTIEEAVRTAAEYMDARLPGWADRIDVDTLDVYNHVTCIGGQTGLRWEDLNAEWDRLNPNLFFHAPFADRDANSSWVAEVEARLVAV